MAPLHRRVAVLGAVRQLLEEHGLPSDRLEAWKDGSNLLVRPVPGPRILRRATLPRRVRRDPLPHGLFLVHGWGMAAVAFIEHEPGTVPAPGACLVALDAVHAAMRDYPGDLPLLGPVTSDLDLALGFAVGEQILEGERADELRRRRDELVPRLLELDPVVVPQHGDAFPRNAVPRRDGGATWIDLEDACRAPRSWDLAVLARNTGDDGILR